MSNKSIPTKITKSLGEAICSTDLKERTSLIDQQSIGSALSFLSLSLPTCLITLVAQIISIKSTKLMLLTAMELTFKDRIQAEVNVSGKIKGS